MNDVLLTGGGIIPEEDIKELKKHGTGELFTPGTLMSEISDYIKNWCETHPRE
jgi:methylmalonyl-CoA mutase C-terminal domain/subunit